MSNRILHFEIQADDVERAAAFYRAVFDWKIEPYGGMPDYWYILTAPMDSKEMGINGGLMKRPANTPAPECGTNAFTCTAQVDNYDEIEAKIIAAGGKVAMPKFALPGMAWQGYYLDTEGNVFGIHQPDPGAK